MGIEFSNGSLLREPFNGLFESVTQELILAIDGSYEIPV